MICFKDRTFCASPNCKNECGRKISDLERQDAVHLDMPIAWAYFCDIPAENFNSIKGNEAPE